MHWKGFGRKLSWPNQGTIKEISWSVWGTLRIASVRIGGALAKIQTGHGLDMIVTAKKLARWDTRTAL
jgi:hypothetical protein